MMMPPRAYVFIGLNAVRILSIVTLLLVFASNVTTLANDIKAVNRFMQNPNKNMTVLTSNGNFTVYPDYIDGSTVPNQPAGVFWAVLNRLFIIGQTFVLILSEFGFPSNFFATYFPVLGKDFGLGALGTIQMLIGAAILSHRVDTFTLVSAFLLFSVGCLNAFLGLVFRQSAKSKRSVTSWKEETKSVLPTVKEDFRPMMANAGAHILNKAPFPVSTIGKTFVSPSHTGSTLVSNAEEPKSYTVLGFGRQAEKAAAMKGYFINRPVEALPKYATPRPAAPHED